MIESQFADMDTSSFEQEETTMALVKGSGADGYLSSINFSRAMVTYAQNTWRWINQWIPWITSREMMAHFLVSLWNRLQVWSILREKCYFLKKKDQYQLLQWVQQMINSPTVTNFKEDWRDGIVLCTLLEALIPGSCPRHDLLHPKQEILNIELGFKLASRHLGIQSDMTPTDIANMVDGIESRLAYFITRLRSRHTSGPLLNRVFLKSRMEETPMHHPACYARGMGLLIGVKGNKAFFNIYFQANELMDVVIEIEGPNGEYYTERITVRSPRRKGCNSVSSTINKEFESELTSGRVINIPLEYEIFPKKIAVNYTPPSSGRYNLSLISRGQHIFGSPFKVMVDNDSTSTVGQKKYLGNGMMRNDSSRNLFNFSNTDVHLMTPLDDQTNGIIIKKKLLKTIVYRQYADIVLLGDEPLPQDPRAWLSTSASSEQDSNLLDWSSIYNNSAVVCNHDDISSKFETLSIMSPDSVKIHEITDECLNSGDNEEQNINNDGQDWESNVKIDSENDKHRELITVPIAELHGDKHIDNLKENCILNSDMQNQSNFLEEAISPIFEPNEDLEINDSIETNRSDPDSKLETTKESTLYNNTSPLMNGVKGISAELNRLYRSCQPKFPENGYKVKDIDEIIFQRRRSDKDEPISKNAPTSRCIPGIACSPKTKCNAFGGHIGGGGIPARVPEALINDWADLWNQEGEGIVTNLVRQYEKILNGYKEDHNTPLLNHSE